jgi:hypothetical protein
MGAMNQVGVESREISFSGNHAADGRLNAQQRRVASPIQGVRVKRLSPAADVSLASPAPVKTFFTKVEVECRKCGRKFEIDFYPYVPNPIRVRTGGATLVPYLQEILDQEFGPQPDLIRLDEPPTHVESCSACTRRRIPREGDTFKKRSYRGRFHTVGCKKDKGKSRFLPELDPDSGYDVVDHTLTVAYRKSRYGQGIDYGNDQSEITESLHESEKLKHARKVLDTLSVREIEEKWGIPRTTASRAKKAVQELAKAANGIRR